MDTNHRTAPRWIAEALEAACQADTRAMLDADDADALAAALIERLPLEAIGREGTISGVMRVLTDGDSEVVQLAELYQNACRVLDATGAPYERELTDDGDPQVVRLNLAGRIQWLAEQRPTRLDLQRVEAERESFRSDAIHARALADVIGKRDAAIAELTAERDQLQKMYEGASDDLDRERTAHQEAEAAAANREVALAVDLDNARETIAQRDAEAVKQIAERDEERRLRDQTIRSLVESDMPAGDLRRALAELIGLSDRERVFAATDRQVLRAKIADQAAYIEQLECEIDALEDEIWEDEP